MKRIRHSIKRKNIPQTKLVSLTSRNWYDSNEELISWTGNTGNAYIGPSTGDTIYNVSGGTVTSGYYRWGTPTANIWNAITGTTTYIKTQIYDNYQIPLFLDSKVDEYGPMVGFDKNIANESQSVSINFNYSVNCNVVEITGTTNATTTRLFDELQFTIHWGDNTTSAISVNGIATKAYADNGNKDIKISLNEPWFSQEVIKVVAVNCSENLTPTPTMTQTPTVTPTVSISASPTPTASITPSVTPSVTQTKTPTATPTVTPTNTITPTVTPTNTVTQTPTPTVDCTFSGGTAQFVAYEILPVTGLVWETTNNVSGVTTCADAGWVISSDNLAIRYNVSDSQNCGGTCNATQTGTATATITVGASDTYLNIDFEGIGELEASFYEVITFKLDGTQIARGNAPGGGLQCQMGPIVETIQVPGPYLLSAGTVHTLLINFSTNDPLFHVGAYYQVNLSFT